MYSNSISTLIHSIPSPSQLFARFGKRLMAQKFSTNAFSSESIVLLTEDSSTGVRRVTLNNPSKRNALSAAMIQQLYHALHDDIGQTRAIVLNANGGKVFSSGHDLKELANFDRAQSEKMFRKFGELMLSIRSLPVPIICQVNGLATAAGCQLVASCDIVLATEQSQFSTPGANVGIFCSTPGIALSRTVNLKQAAYMVLTGKLITAQEAHTAGLITRVVTESQLESETETILQAILEKSRTVVAFGKKFFYKQLELDLSTAYSKGACIMADNLQLKDGREGLEAFIDKRKANWTHLDE